MIMGNNYLAVRINDANWVYSIPNMRQLSL